MPLPFIASLFHDGLPSWMPHPWLMAKVGGTLSVVALTKSIASGAVCVSDRKMHGRVIIMTGGTSGIGAEAAFELGRRGAQLVLLTRQPASDPFLIDYIDDLRERTNNQLIYAEQVDLTSLHSIRKFATHWVDNSPARRLDMVILCAATMTPPGGKRTETPEGIETTWMVNFLANFHLLSILSPAIRAQPFDRDVRIIVPTCSTYISSPPLDSVLDKKTWTPGRAYAQSKLALMVFCQAYQKHLDAFKRPDSLPMTARTLMVDPGYARTPGMRRWLSRGSLLGLLIYMITYAFWWLLLKSPSRGAQSILYAALESSLVRGEGGKLIKECMEVDCARKDVKDEEVAKKLWESSDKLIERAEKEGAMRRAREKAAQKQQEEEGKKEEQAEEIEALVEAISKGSRRSKKKAKNAEKAAPSKS